MDKGNLICDDVTVTGTEKSQEAGMWLEMLQSAVKLETRGVRIPCLYKKQSGTVWRGQFSSVVVLVIVVTVGRGGVWYCVETAILFCDGAGNCGNTR